MGFLAPLLLGLGLALAVPLMIHLFHRHQGPRVAFPALRYLRRAEREHALQIRLRQVAVLAARLLVLALVALAAARPFLRRGTGRHEPTAVVIVLDNSLSTGRVDGEARILDRLVDRAAETLAAGGPDDRFWLLPAAGAAPAVTAPARELTERLRALGPVDDVADLTAAVRRAGALLEAGAGARAREIHLLTDLQATSFPEPVITSGIGLVLFAATAPDQPSRAVVSVEVGGGVPPRAGQRSTLAIRVMGPPGDSVEARLVMDGGVRAAALAPTGATTLIPFPARGAGPATGRVEIEADDLRGDDRRFFAVDVRPPPAVAITTPLPFVDDAIAVLEEAERVRRSDAATADVVLAPEGVGLDSARPDAAVVVMPPDDATRLPALNRRLAQASIPWRFEAVPAAGEGRLAPAPGESGLARALEPVRVRRSYRLTPLDGLPVDTLLRLRDGAPWIVRGQRAPGTPFLLVASSFAGDATDVPVSAAMLPLLDRLLGGWTASTAPHRALEPGDVVTLPARARVVTTPDGRRMDVEGGAPFTVPPMAGIYTVASADALLEALAVNAPARESNLAAARGAAVAPGATIVERADRWPAAIYRHRRGDEIGGWLLAAALALLAVEALLAAAGRESRGSAPRSTASAQEGD